MSEEKLTERASFELPFGRTLNIKELSYGNNLEMLRLIFREGRRFTTIDIDKKSAQEICDNITDWIKQK